MYKFILVLLFSVTAFAAENKLLPVEIEIMELTPKLGLVKVLEFSFDGKTCLVQTSSKNKRTESNEKCHRIITNLKKELSEKLAPSEYINPKGHYYDVRFKTSENGWQQTVLKEPMTQCNSKGKCDKPMAAPAREIAKTLLQEFAK